MVIVTPSNWLYELVKKSYLKEYFIKVINNGIDLEIFKYRESNFKQIYNIKDKYIILGVANVWSDKKGFTEFLKLSEKIKSDEIIVLVGITKRQKRLLPNNIIGIEKTNNAIELAKIYSAADVFVNPTLEDNLPTVNIEAIACGLPVVTYDTGGSPETVLQNNGYIVKKGDMDGLLDCIRKVKRYEKDKYDNSYTKNLIQQYNKTNKFNQYINLYEEIQNYKK